MKSNQAQLAAILVSVVETRWPREPLDEALREDWMLAAMDGDPIVLLEEAWALFAEEGAPFRPLPGDLLRKAREKCPPAPSSFTLAVSLGRAKAAKDDPTIDMAGVLAVVGRFGERRWSECMEHGPKPSDEEAWMRCVRDQIVFALAKKSMNERGSPPWRQKELGGLPAPTNAVMSALSAPATTNETDHDDFRAKLSGLADNKRLS